MSQIKRRRFALAFTVCTLFTLLIAPRAFAGLIVDTGVPAGSSVFSLAPDQFLAAEFTTVEDWLVNGVEGWLTTAAGGPEGTVALYTDGGDVPGTELFSSIFMGKQVPSWQGATGLSWLLPAGTYWAAFEVRQGQTLTASMPVRAPMPLPTAFFLDLNGAWSPTGGSIGLRISAERASHSVSAPAIPFLFAIAWLAFRALRHG